MNKTEFIARVAEQAGPATKQKIHIPARKAVKFKAGAALDLNAAPAKKAPAKKAKK